MNVLAYFKWYRRWRGGKWGLVTGYMWGKRWVRVSCDCVERVEENYCEE